MTFMGVSMIWGQQSVFWRNEAANGNFENGSCAEIGTGNSQWWYPGFGGNQARNRPDCWDGSTSRHNIEIGSNHQTTMTLNTTFWGLRSLTLTTGATSSRIFNSSPDDATRGLSFTNGLYNNSNSGISHTFNSCIGIDAASVTIRTNTSGSTTNFNREIFGNSNTITFDGSGTTNINSTISGVGCAITKNGLGLLNLSEGNSYTGSTTINGGELKLNKTGGGTVPSGNSIIINSGGTLKVSSNQTLSSISLNSGGTLIVDAGVTLSLTTFSQNGTVTNNGTILVNGTPLPVTFTSLTGNIRNGQAQLNWTMADEHNVDHYQVEESVNGRQFQSFTQVDAASRSSYQTIDAQLHTGANYYRVKAVDIDGKLTYSKIIRLENSAIDQQIRVYPNPSQGELTLGLNIAAGNYQIRVINAVGQIVLQQPLTHEGGSRSLPLALPKLNAGIYQLEVRGGMQKYVRSVRID